MWDWNGTLLDDHQICTDNFNRCIARQKIAPISPEEFRRIYRHPIIDMYLDVGFQFNEQYTFADLSADWYRFYHQTIELAQLFPQVSPLLHALHGLGKTQIVCSLLEDEYLARQCHKHNIQSYFHFISGHHNQEADSKVARGSALIRPYLEQGKSVIVVGDSSHDAQVASAAGCDCILLGTGHESKERLLQNQGVKFLHSLEDLLF